MKDILAFWHSAIQNGILEKGPVENDIRENGIRENGIEGKAFWKMWHLLRIALRRKAFRITVFGRMALW
jgi:hypothetical protein